MANYAENKKAYFNYEILEKFEGGLVLTGNEVKAIRNKQIRLVDSYLVFKDEELFLINAKISAYQKNNKFLSDELRDRKVLLNKKELIYLKNSLKQKGLTLVPLKVYNKNKVIKLEFALAKGKKKFEKRRKILTREINREINRQFKNQFGDDRNRP
ncbi:MAG TPA: SsrA-binding protein SmpB [Candidatus Paceibacterota bacterium]|nr:SsrA-binding protein SmpB [Candidatus Paceibacterota bacterium]